MWLLCAVANAETPDQVADKVKNVGNDVQAKLDQAGKDVSDKINGADVQAKLDNVGKDVKDKINGKQCALGGG